MAFLVVGISYWYRKNWIIDLEISIFIVLKSLLLFFSSILIWWMDVKVCRICNTEKIIDEYHKLFEKIILVEKKHILISYYNNREKILQYCEEYTQCNKEIIADRTKEKWWIQNRDQYAKRTNSINNVEIKHCCFVNCHGCLRSFNMGCWSFWKSDMLKSTIMLVASIICLGSCFYYVLD